MARNRVKKTICPNCDFKFLETNNYCPNCGQENHTHKLPLKHFLIEFLESLFHFDTKILATLRDLIIKPGQVTVNFNQNKRNRYVPPMRLYIFASFVFFFLLAVIPEKSSKTSISNNAKPSQTIDLNYHFGSSSSDTAGEYILKQLRLLPVPSDSLIDAYLKATDTEITWFNKGFFHGLVKIISGHETINDVIHKFYKKLSSLMFFLMPLFAAYLYLFYRRKKLYYTEHLIFSLHYHTLAFLLLSIWQLLSFIGLNSDIYILATLMVYLFLSLHTIYTQSWVKTIIKALLITLIYSISLIVILLAGFILSFAG